MGAFEISGWARKRPNDFLHVLRKSEFKNSVAEFLNLFWKIHCNANTKNVELSTIYDDRR